MFSKVKEALLKLERHLFLFEEWVLVFGLITMVTMGTLQVVLRNFFNTGVEWADMFVRALVLWVGFLGASLATRKSKHIRIDIFSKIMTGKRSSVVREVILNVLSLALVILLLKASIEFTRAEATNQMTAFLNVPTWIVFIIVPISLGLIAIRLVIEIMLGRPIEQEEYKREYKEVDAQ
jgi:TRAP-type C4-dicarboxylate transport system permease small subunit